MTEQRSKYPTSTSNFPDWKTDLPLASFYPPPQEIKVKNETCYANQIPITPKTKILPSQFIFLLSLRQMMSWAASGLILSCLLMYPTSKWLPLKHSCVSLFLLFSPLQELCNTWKHGIARPTHETAKTQANPQGLEQSSGKTDIHLN